ncbi:MAG: hypothetical protein A3J83_01795 [Elusimicrobia bacterium RIFOXYA2_FULL_40_6]|nr:MAG: hypothetical protein A3J83_01795 [Elusimicrobia bacterium RIFOXYA2_FULL_40_6]
MGNEFQKASAGFSLGRGSLRFDYAFSMSLNGVSESLSGNHNLSLIVLFGVKPQQSFKPVKPVPAKTIQTPAPAKKLTAQPQKKKNIENKVIIKVDEQTGDQKTLESLDELDEESDELQPAQKDTKTVEPESEDFEDEPEVVKPKPEEAPKIEPKVELKKAEPKVEPKPAPKAVEPIEDEEEDEEF